MSTISSYRGVHGCFLIQGLGVERSLSIAVFPIGSLLLLAIFHYFFNGSLIVWRLMKVISPSVLVNVEQE